MRAIPVVSLLVSALAVLGCTEPQRDDPRLAPKPRSEPEIAREAPVVTAPETSADDTGHQAFMDNRVNRMGLASYQQLAPPLTGNDAGALTWFGDPARPGLGFMRRASVETPVEIFHLAATEAGWSSPIAAGIPAFRIHALSGIATLDSGRSMLVMVGDRTDYAELLGIPDDGSDDGTGDPGISEAEIIRLQNQNRRLFSSVLVAGRWSRPLPITGTLGVMFAAVASGYQPGSQDASQDRALVLFARDDDNDYETTADRDLHAAAFTGLHWREPIRLTHDPAREYAVQVAFIAGRHVAVWVRDSDADLTTPGDRTLHHAIFDADGTLLAGPAPITSAVYHRPRPILGEIAGEPVVLFAGNPDSSGTAHPLLQTRLSGAGTGSWTAPQDTGLQVGTVSRGEIFQHGDSALLIYEDDNTLVAAARCAGCSGDSEDSGAWHSSGLVQDYNASSVRLGEASYSLDPEGYLSIAAIADPRLGQPGVAGALFHLRVPLHSDLALGNMTPPRRPVEVGDTVTLEIPVRNQGFRHSGAFRVEVRDGDTVRGAVEVTGGLHPGQSGTYQLPFVVERPQHHLTIAVTTADSRPELELDNNQQLHTVAVRPDFTVVAVERRDQTIVARIRDVKSVATTPVSVDFILIENNVRTVLSETLYDPSSDLPVELDVPDLADRSDPFTISVRVNLRTQVIEDNYDNNLSVYRHRPGVDFELTDLAVTSRLVRVHVRNIGERESDQVQILLTTDPELFSSPAPIPGIGPLVLQTVAMVDGQAVLEVSREILEDQEGYFVYAVANPYGTVPELDRSNNSRRTARVPAFARPPLYALSAIDLGPASRTTGAIAVRDGDPEDNAVNIGPDARVQGDIRGDGVRLGPRAAVIGTVTHNRLSLGPGASISEQPRTPLELPVEASLEALPEIVPGDTDVAVPRGTTRELPPGNHGAICVACGSDGPGSKSGGRDQVETASPGPALLILSGGVYHVTAIDVAANGHILCRAACEIRVAGDIDLAATGTLGLEDFGQDPVDAPLPAESIRVLVAGDGVTLARGAAIHGHLVAPHGRVEIGNSSVAHGTIAADRIRLGHGARFDSSIEAPVSAALPVTIRSESRSTSGGRR